ncbi:MAG: Clp protease N-terminal domain-containing protein [Candidatus Latescibacteria bacterium]|nr:Clp protease N-terminal domain-containing protein [Candidatus Latescibacterota bacterium]
MDQAWKEAQSLKDEYISKAHIVLAMLGANGAGLNVFSQKRTWPVKQGKDSKQRFEPIEKQLAETPLWP